MKLIAGFLILISLSTLQTNCSSYISEQTDSVYMDYDYEELGYKLFEPRKKHFLPYELEEISGLSYYKKNQLLAIEDEHAELYFINTKTGKIIRKIDFGKSGDYEGVEVMGESVFILKSNGDIYSFKLSDENKVDADNENTVLEGENDAEGLGAYKGDLLIALKGSGDTDDNNADGKGFYRYNISKKEIVEEELFDVEKEDLTEFISDRKFFNKVNDFDPSAIAMHPITKDIYVLSADKVLAIFNGNFEIKEVIKLPVVAYNQAEGICFAPDGTMYISSEGDGGKGKLMIIDYNR